MSNAVQKVPFTSGLITGDVILANLMEFLATRNLNVSDVMRRK
jgi:hypothetical protein